MNRFVDPPPSSAAATISCIWLVTVSYWLDHSIPCGNKITRCESKDGIERDCPKCHEPILFLDFETVDELVDHPEVLAPDDRGNFARRSDFVKKWQAGILRSPEQLPDLSGDQITLRWDTDQDTRGIIIRTEDQVIWRQPLGYEHYEYFVDALKILKVKYGRALVDVIPTERVRLYLWGDPLSALEICEEARRKLRDEGS